LLVPLAGIQCAAYPLATTPNDLHDYDSIRDGTNNNSRLHFEAMVVQAMDTELARLIGHVDLTETTGILGPPYSSMARRRATGWSDDHLHSADLYAPILDLFDVDIETVVPDELIHDSRSFVSVLDHAAYARDSAEIMVHNSFGNNAAERIMEGD
jgi:hypothetical protein